MEEVKATIGDRPVYITFDIDGIDPCFAPGTGKSYFHDKLCLFSTPRIGVEYVTLLVCMWVCTITQEIFHSLP